jgi:hypothetical protein
MCDAYFSTLSEIFIRRPYAKERCPSTSAWQSTPFPEQEDGLVMPPRPSRRTRVDVLEWSLQPPGTAFEHHESFPPDISSCRPGPSGH